MMVFAILQFDLALEGFKVVAFAESEALIKAEFENIQSKNPVHKPHLLRADREQIISQMLGNRLGQLHDVLLRLESKLNE